MSTQPGPGYQQAQSEPGEGDDAPPPAFNPDAVNPNDYAQPQQPQLPPATSSYGAIPSQPAYSQQPQQPQYMVQPQPQQPIRQQIVQPPLYNPQQPQQQIQYVNQYGQPIQQQNVSPVVVVPPNQQQVHQQSIIYAQPQNQNQALIAPYKPIYDYRMPSDKDRNKRYLAAMGGSLAIILLVCLIYFIFILSVTAYGVYRL